MPLSKSESSSISPQTRDIVSQGLWSNNAALVQLLGLCPLLAVSNSVVNAAGLGLATIGVLLGSNGIVSLSRHRLTPAIRLPIFVLIIATFTTCAELLLRAFAIELYQALGIFIPLIVTNCTILGRAESFASKNASGPFPARWPDDRPGLCRCSAGTGHAQGVGRNRRRICQHGSSAAFCWQLDPAR